MELRQLRQFIAVAEERHFGRAAERLHMAQPALSQQIRLLETRLGVRLLERTTRRVDLTPAGQVLLDGGRRVEADLEALTAEVRQVGGGVAGVVRVGFPGSVTYGDMPRLVREVRRRMPGVTLLPEGEMLTPALEAGLRSGDLHAALLRPPVVSAELEHRLVRRDELVLAVPQDSALCGDQSVALRELEGQPFVSHPPGSALHRAVNGLCRAAGFSPRVARVAPGTSAALSLVAAGTGFAVVPAPARALQLPGVSYAGLAGAPDIELLLAWRRGDRSALLGNLLEILGEPGEGSAGHATVVE